MALERIKETGDIFWAMSDRNWILDGATVHVSMVGFDNGNQSRRRDLIDGITTSSIHSNLTDWAHAQRSERSGSRKTLTLFLRHDEARAFDISERQTIEC